ncbi:50S ribosomal protein L9 [Candidatus Parcubacteria bacterium]|nr:50S ribosomal protein L9 [Candidatus Parcubacteria bacterium]
MRVILLKDVRGVGSIRDIKDVAEGYASNFLFPRKLAEPATEEKIKSLEAAKETHTAQLKLEEEQLIKKIESLNSKSIKLQSRATEKGGLFKSISAGDIAKAIREQHSLEIPESVVSFSTPIKTVGEHVVKLHSKSTKVDFGVIVMAS